MENRMYWTITVGWTDYAQTNEATVAEWQGAINGQIKLPARPVAAGYPYALAAEVTVEATSLRKALTAGLARVEKGVGCHADSVHAARTKTAKGDPE